MERPDGLPLEYHVIVEARRKERGRKLNPETSAAAISPKAELHLFAEGKLWSYRVQLRIRTRSQAVRFDEVVDIFAKALFVDRTSTVLFLQPIADR